MKELNACREIWIVSYSLFLFVLLSGCLVTVRNFRCANGVHILWPSWISLPFLRLFSAICVFVGIWIEFYILYPSEVFKFYNKGFQFYNNWKPLWFLVFISVGTCLCSAHSRAFLWNFSRIIIYWNIVLFVMLVCTTWSFLCIHCSILLQCLWAKN